MGRSLTVLSPKQAAAHDRYQERLERSRAAAAEISKFWTDYWYNLYLIRRDGDWKAVTAPRPDGRQVFEDWLDDWRREPWASSRSQFFAVMAAIDTWISLGADDADVRQLLGQRSVAIGQDLEQWVTGKGTNKKLRPLVAAKLEAGGETPLEAIKRIASLGADDARAEVSRYTGQDFLFIPSGSAFREGSWRAMFDVRWDNADTGLRGIYQVEVTVRRVMDLKGQAVSSPTDQLKLIPMRVLDWVLSKFGLRADQVKAWPRPSHKGSDRP